MLGLSATPSRIWPCFVWKGILLPRNAVEFTVGVIVLLSTCLTIRAQAQIYAGALGGVATLSGDARSVLNPGSTAFSLYDPQNGGAIEILVGKHFSDYLTVQANYIWNRNRMHLTSASTTNGTLQGYEETRLSSQQSVIADLLVYFRHRHSRLRPYLSVGTGLVHFASSQRTVEQLLGGAVLPQRDFSANMISLHVPVGMDVRLAKRWNFRYTFSETLSTNPIDDQLAPRGQHRLQNFQNLFGFVTQF